MNDTTKGAHGSNNMECPVCLGRLSAPKVLPCGHSFCETCLEPLIRTERDQRLVSCPECRETANVPEDGFPTNYTLEEALRHLRDDERTKKCKGCEKGFSDAEVMRCLTCEKDFCEREVAVCEMCALRSHKEHDILDLPTWPKDCFKVVGSGQTSLVLTSVSELSGNPKHSEKVEISGALWHLEARLRTDVDDEVVYWNLFCEPPDKCRSWADVVLGLNGPEPDEEDEEPVTFRKMLFGNGIKVPPCGFHQSKSTYQEMFGEGPLTVTAHLIVYEDMFAHGSEHSDLKLSVEGQDIHVKRGTDWHPLLRILQTKHILHLHVLSAASAPLANLMYTATDAELSLSGFGAFELLTFLLAVYPTHGSTQDVYTSSPKMRAIYKLASAYEVKWLFGDTDTYLKADSDDEDACSRLCVAQDMQRHEVLTHIISCMTADDIEKACAEAKRNEYDYNASTLLKLLDKYIQLTADNSDSSSTVS